MNSEILTVGSLFIDQYDQIRHFGGAPANVSVNLSLLGTNSKLLTINSSDQEGNDYKKYLASLGIDLFETGIKLKKLPICYFKTNSLGETQEITWTDNGLVEAFKNLELNPKTISQYGVIHLGSCEENFALKVSQVANSESKLSYNPGVWVQDGIKYFTNIHPLSDFLFLNESEYQILVSEGYIQKPEDLIKNLKQIAVITRGNKPTICVNSERKQEIEFPFLGSIVDEVGAGDAFISAFLWSHLKGYPLDRCVKNGNLLGGLVCGKVGAQANRKMANEFHKLSKE